MKKWVGLLLVYGICHAETLEGDPSSWGLGSALRTASIPYETSQPEGRLDSYVLLLYLDTPWLYLDGTSGGLKLYDSPAWEFSAYSGIHFVDLPHHDANAFSDDTVDLGFRFRYRDDDWRGELYLLSDPAWRLHGILRFDLPQRSRSFQFDPFAELHYKSQEYNSFYYGMNRTAIGADVGAAVGIEGRWYLNDTFALLADAKAKYLGYQTAGADTVDDPVQNEIYIGAGIFQNDTAPTISFLDTGYLRLAFGEATPSSFTEIISGQGSRDLHRLYMLSLFYGYPVSKQLFGAPIHSYATFGFVHHFGQELQSPAQEYIAGLKLYYWPESWWLRFGVGTGLSYITETTYIENYINAKDGYDHTSHLMHYLDFSFDFSLQHLFGRTWKPYWFGYGLHHRSGVFESAHQYGQIKGGSNYNTLYLLWDFE